jgi:hypothetical protein
MNSAISSPADPAYELCLFDTLSALFTVSQSLYVLALGAECTHIRSTLEAASNDATLRASQPVSSHQ